MRIVFLYGFRINDVNGDVKFKVLVDDMDAKESAEVNMGSVYLSNSRVDDLTVKGQINARADDIEAEEGAQLGMASLLVNNSTVDDIKISRITAIMDDVTVEEGGEGYFSTLKLQNSSMDDAKFKGYTNVGRDDITVPEGTLMTLASGVIENTDVGGDLSMYLHADSDDGMDFSDDSVVIFGGVNIR